MTPLLKHPVLRCGAVAGAVALVMPTTGPALAVAQSLSPERGTLVVVNKRANTASVIDIETGGTIAELPTGLGPHEATISRDGRTAVVTDYAGGNSLTVIDVTRPAVVRTIDLSRYPRPHGIAFLPGDSIVAVTSEASQQVVLVRVSDGSVVQAIPTGQRGSHMLAVVASGRRIYTSNGAGTVSELDAHAGERVGILDVAPQLEAITVTPDGEEVWVGSNERGTVSVLNTQTGEIDEALRGLSWPYRIFITPDQRLAVIPDLRRDEVRFVDRATRRELKVLAIPASGPQGLTLGPDGRSLYLSLNRQDRLAVIDLASMEVVRYIETGSGPDGVVFSPLTLQH